MAVKKAKKKVKVNKVKPKKKVVSKKAAPKKATHKKALHKKVVAKKTTHKKVAPKKGKAKKIVVKKSAPKKVAPKKEIKVTKVAKVSKVAPKIDKKAEKKKAQPIVQKVKKCKKSLCKEPASINGYCRYHYIAGWRTENIDKKVKKLSHLEKTINEIKKRFTPEYLELIKADLASDENFRKVIKDMDLEEDINDFEISDDTQRIIESYSSLVDLERED